MIREAIAILEKGARLVPSYSGITGLLAGCHALSGDLARADHVLATLTADRGPPRQGPRDLSCDLLEFDQAAGYFEQALLFGPLHGHGIAKHIQRTSEDVLQVEHGSLYPALHRLEKSGCITSKWEQTDRGREMRMYRLTARGRKQLTIEQSRWDELVRAMARVLKPV